MWLERNPMTKHNYVFEIGCEEIPARFVPGLMSALEGKLREALMKQRIAYEAITPFATYRRLAVEISGLAAFSESETQELRGPIAKISRNDAGDWLPPALGFLKRYGLGPDAVDQLRIETVQGADYVFLTHVIPSQKTLNLLPALVVTAVTQIPLPVEMFWGEKQGPFVRPVHWILSLLDAQVLPLSLFGVAADRYTYGHRFLTQNGSQVDFASGEKVPVPCASDYETLLVGKRVFANVETRRKCIYNALPISARQGKEALLDEVTYLTEWPKVIKGKIDRKYLHLPGEAIATCIESNQRYFSLCGKSGVLQESEADLDSVWIVADSVTPENEATILAGNMKVLNARLEDVLFFWTEDRKRPLADNVDALKNVMYQKNLGSLYDKALRVEGVVGQLADALSWSAEDRAHVMRAAFLSKADQVSQMVMEMTELQGTMGSIYALASGESEAVAQALFDLYQPIPATRVGALLAIADRADTLVACFRNGLIPTGSKDPWGLRREALRLVNALLFDFGDMKPFKTLSLTAVLKMAAGVLDMSFGKANSETYFDQCMTLCRDRFAYFLFEDNRMLLSCPRLDQDIVAAVVSESALFPVKQWGWGQKLQDLRGLNPLAFKAFVETAIRVKRLAGSSDPMCDPRLLKEPEELVLYDTLTGFAERELLTSATVVGAPDLSLWCTTWVPALRRFFDNVLVMAPDPQIKANRLGLLAWANRQFEVVGDLEKIVISGV
jgi:glycyl-tRNA synthetase beta chain